MQHNIFNRIPFTENDRNMINLVKGLSGIKELNLENTEYFMVRTNTQSFSSVSQLPPGYLVTPPGQPLPEDMPLNIDTFLITTSAHPDEKITYTSDADIVVMDDKIDGGFF